MKQQIDDSIHKLIENAKSLRNAGNNPEAYHPFLLNLYATIKAVLTNRFWQHLPTLPPDKQKKAFDDYMAILLVDDADSLEKWGEILMHCNGGVSEEDVDTLQELDKEHALVSEQEDGNLRINPDQKLCDKSIALTKLLGFHQKPTEPSLKHPQKQNDFSSTFVLVNLQKWRDKRISPPFYERKVPLLKKPISVHDEATVITHRSIDGYDKPFFTLEVITSGDQCLDSLLPVENKLDMESYRLNGTINTEIPLDSKELNYAKKTWNGFQEGQQKFALTTLLGTTTDLLLAVDFSSVLGTVDFKELPSAWFGDLRNEEEPQNIPIIRSMDSSLWFAKVSPDNSIPEKKHRLKIQWELCETPDDGEVYIFSYASLLSTRQISSVLGREVRKGDLKMAKLRNHRLEWSAFCPALSKCEGDIDFDPNYIASANVHPAQGESANGVLFRIKRDELERLDAREQNYCRVNVTELVDETDGIPVYTYSFIPRGPIEKFSEQAFIRKDYVDLLDHSLQEFGESFRTEYWESFGNPANLPICDAYPAGERTRYSL
jgi:hypothetical protein